jgi:hypothetical protein
MPRKPYTHHYIYKTTNLINNKYYVGMHSTNNLDDGYIGSGDRLKKSINKYGKENFKVEILESLPDRVSLKEREKQIVNEELLDDKLSLNLCLGGSGGFISPEGVKKGGVLSGNLNSFRMKNDTEFRDKMITKLKLIQKEKVKELGEEHPLIKSKYDWTGKKHSLETIIKMEKSKKNHGKGINNSQYGTCWITNEIQNKKIFKGDSIPEGWRLGRIIK